MAGSSFLPATGALPGSAVVSALALLPASLEVKDGDEVDLAALSKGFVLLMAVPLRDTAPAWFALALPEAVTVDLWWAASSSCDGVVCR